MEQFNEDEELVLAAEKRQLIKIQHYQEGQRIRKESLEEGKAEGKLASKKEDTLKLFKKMFPQENDDWLNNLSLLQYDKIFDTLLDNQNLNTIKEIVKKTR